MATVPNPRTWATGDKESAARLNLEMRDAIDFLLSPPRCQVSQVTTGTTLANGVYGLLLFDSEAYDTDSMHSLVTNTGRLTFNTAGLWLVHAYVGLPSATYTTAAMNTRLNAAGSSTGGTSVRTWVFDPLASVRECFEYTVAAGDYMETFVTQTSGASRITSLGQFNVTGMTARLVAPA